MHPTAAASFGLAPVGVEARVSERVRIDHFGYSSWSTFDATVEA